jgi:signal transduction histidine kinase/CheY-like chemotaxis protein
LLRGSIADWPRDHTPEPAPQENERMSGESQPAFTAGGMAGDLALRVANLTSNLITIVDASTMAPVEINAALRKALGWSDNQPLAALADDLHPEDAGRVRQHWAAALALPDDGIHRCVYRLRTTDGRWLWLRERAIVGRRDAAGAARMVVCVARDISREMAAQDSVDTIAQRFSLALAASGVTVFAQDRDLRYTWIHNPGLDFHAHRVLGRRDSEVTERPEEGLLLEAIKRRSIDERQRVTEEVVVHYGGRPTWWRITVEPVIDRDGAVTGITCATYEITQTKESERELKAAKQAADEANAAKDRFLAMLSHELRTPLTPILLSARILERRPDDRETVLDRAGVIRRCVETETRLVDDLLDLSRISLDKVVLTRVPVSLHEVIARAVDVCEADAHEAGVAIALQLDARRCWVHGDARRLQQVVWNLVRNAIKFSHAGQVVRVVTRNVAAAETDEADRPVAATGESIELQVIDQGIGIDADMLPRLFRPFEQGDVEVTRRFGGLGLGLAIVERLVHLHGGAARAHSDGAGTGACFSVRLPLADLPAPMRSLDRPHAPAAGHALAVAADTENALALTTMLRGAGWQATMAPSEAAALALARATRFDLVLVDLGLTDGDPFNLLASLREAGERMPVVALAARDADFDRDGVLRVGFTDCLRAPLEAASLALLASRLATAASPAVAPLD